MTVPAPSLRNPAVPLSFYRTFADFTDPGTTLSLTLATPEAGTVLQDATIECLAAFAGGAISEVTISIGITNALDHFASAKSVIAVGSQFSSNVGGYVFDGATALLATIITAGGNLDDLTAGIVRLVITAANRDGLKAPSTSEIKGNSGIFSSSLANDPSTTSGLTYGYTGGIVDSRTLSTVGSVAGGTVELSDNTTNFVYYSADTNSVQVSTVDFPHLIVDFPMAQVSTSGGQITAIEDMRTFVQVYKAFLTFFGLEVGQNVGDTSGLNYEIYNKPIRNPAGLVTSTNGQVALTDNAINYVSFTAQGTTIANTSGFTPGNIPAQIVTTAAGQVTNVEDVRSFLYAPGPGPLQFIATGGAAGNITCTGISVGDKLESVLRFTAGALVSVLTSQFTITGANQINNSGGTDTTGSTLLVTWQKLTA